MPATARRQVDASLTTPTGAKKRNKEIVMGQVSPTARQGTAAVWPRPDREMTDVSKVALRLYRQSMHESLSTMHAYANVHREVWSSRLGTHMESHYRTTTTIGVSSLDVYSNGIDYGSQKVQRLSEKLTCNL